MKTLECSLTKFIKLITKHCDFQLQIKNHHSPNNFIFLSLTATRARTHMD